MTTPALLRSLLGATVLAAVAAPAGAQITGSLPSGHPMKDGGVGGGAFGSTGSFGRSGFGGGVGLRGFGAGGGFNRGVFGGGVFNSGVYNRGFYGGGFYGGYPFGAPGFGYGGYGYGGYGPGYYGYGITPPVFAPGVAVGTGLGPVLLPGYGNFTATVDPNSIYGGNPNAFNSRGRALERAAGYGPIAPGPVPAAGFGVNPVLDGALREEADRWRAPIDLGDAGPPPAAPRPADERELADALRDERSGDEAFRELNFRRALSFYQRAAAAAPTRGEPLYSAAFARIALGQFAAAGEDLRRAVALNPSLPVSGPTLRELFGPNHSIARTAALGGVAEYARADVRDVDRLFLLGATMHASGDDRAREIFEAAWRLTGGRPHLRPYLDPARVEFAAGSLDAATGDAPAAPLAAPSPQPEFPEAGSPEPPAFDPGDLDPSLEFDPAAGTGERSGR